MTAGSSVLIGVDIGCTTIAGGLVTEDGSVLTSRHAATNLGSRTGVDTVIGMVGELCDEAGNRGVTVEGVGIGMPGLVDPQRGMVTTSANAFVADFHDVALAERISAKTGLPAFADNDVNALALGEWHFGPARGASSCVVLAIGTGV